MRAKRPQIGTQKQNNGPKQQRAAGGHAYMTTNKEAQRCEDAKG
jgi:hypothetical protein